MKILAVSDQVAPAIYSGCIRDRFGDVDMVLSCGDLPFSYLEYIVTMLNVPCFFVHGNHDQPEYTTNGHILSEPGGWIDLDARSVEFRGLLVAGLEGSVRYKLEGIYQYTEAQMVSKARQLALSLLFNRLRYGRYLDILITHAPPLGIHDGQDWPHRGFEVFLRLMERYRPRYLLHGHKHIYGPETWQTRYHHTEVINVYPYRVIEFGKGGNIGR